MFIKELSGHSGCRLELCKEGDLLFVRKTSGAADYNARLKRQCIKQRHFESSALLAAPEVLAHGHSGELFYFDMAFIQGKNFAEYFGFINIHDVAEYIKILFQSLRLAQSTASAETGNIFREKLGQLRPETMAQARAQSALDALDGFDWSRIGHGPCHGDLTLENIIITPKKEIYLIDFLDSFHSSWMMDVAKLLQDLELGWSFRHQRQDVTRDLKLLVAREALFDEIGRMENPEYITSAIYHLLLLHIVRIYPYARDEATLKFLDLAVEKIMSLLENGEGAPATFKRKVVSA